ncbi:MAG: hypothetical protein LW817_06640, partial [Candidatus Caenarcaniphilales bacterium]|nr:hypothetical protein [Candidatus Caenarcaniphilales bacterium]
MRISETLANAYESVKRNGQKALTVGALATASALNPSADAFSQEPSTTIQSEASRAKVVLLTANNNSPSPRPVDLVTFDDGESDPKRGAIDGKPLSITDLSKKASIIGADRSTVEKNLLAFDKTAEREGFVEHILYSVQKGFLTENQAEKLLTMTDVPVASKLMSTIKNRYEAEISKQRELEGLTKEGKLSPEGKQKAIKDTAKYVDGLFE